MAQRKNVSIQMIAQRCGISTATVSRVINNDARVADSTRAVVLAALEACGYQLPAPPAGGIKKVGVVIDTQVNDYYRALLISLHDALAELGLRTITASLGYKKEALPIILRTVYDCNVCGVILVTCDYVSLKNVLDPRIPHVWIDCNDPPEQTADICQVQSDQFAAGVLAAQELFRKGSVHPIILGGSILSHRGIERFEGFRSVYRKQNIEIGEDRIIRTPRVREVLDESKQAIRYLISTGYEFDGVFAVSDWRALGTYLAVNELGIKIPDDMRIIGYDGVSIATRTVLNITSIQQDILHIAKSACEMLIAQIERRPIETKRVIVPVSILNGQTL